MAPFASVSGFLYFYFKLGYTLDISRVSVFIRMINTLFYVAFLFPAGIQGLMLLSLSANRIVEVLKTEEIREMRDDTLPHPAVIENVIIAWQNPEDTKDIKTIHQSQSSEALIGSVNKDDSLSNKHSSLVRVGSFYAEKGKLTMILGKTGSGKSSLLYSLLGETYIISGEKSKIGYRGSIGFVGQNPWVINSTIRENILMGAF